MIQEIATWGTLAAAIATAIATVFLYRVTKVLAVETKRMADASAQPQVVANIIPNHWSILYMDINIENTGNATAFDIDIIFTPPLKDAENSSHDETIPFQKISILKPGQSLQSNLGPYSDYAKKCFSIEVKWKRNPKDTNKECLTYTFDMKIYDGLRYLGERDPLIQIAQEIKEMRNDWKWVAAGSRRLSMNIFDTGDRNRENEEIENRWNLFGSNNKESDE